jgi:CheY-like chemotaxis protein
MLFRAEDEMIVDVDDAWTRTTGLRREDVVGRSRRALDIWNDDADSQRFAALMRAEGEVRDSRFSFNRRLEQEAFDVVLTDAVMPLLGGRELAAQLAERAGDSRRDDDRLLGPRERARRAAERRGTAARQAVHRRRALRRPGRRPRLGAYGGRLTRGRVPGRRLDRRFGARVAQTSLRPDNE